MDVECVRVEYFILANVGVVGNDGFEVAAVQVTGVYVVHGRVAEKVKIPRREG